MQTEQFHVILYTRSHVFLLPPWPLAPSTTNLLQEDTQSSTLLRSSIPVYACLVAKGLIRLSRPIYSYVERDCFQTKL